jgi:hypothetical protein
MSKLTTFTLLTYVAGIRTEHNYLEWVQQVSQLKEGRERSLWEFFYAKCEGELSFWGICKAASVYFFLVFATGFVRRSIDTATQRSIRWMQAKLQNDKDPSLVNGVHQLTDFLKKYINTYKNYSEQRGEGAILAKYQEQAFLSHSLETLAAALSPQIVEHLLTDIPFFAGGLNSSWRPIRWVSWALECLVGRPLHRALLWVLKHKALPRLIPFWIEKGLRKVNSLDQAGEENPLSKMEDAQLPYAGALLKGARLLIDLLSEQRKIPARSSPVSRSIPPRVASSFASTLRFALELHALQQDEQRIKAAFDKRAHPSVNEKSAHQAIDNAVAHGIEAAFQFVTRRDNFPQLSSILLESVLAPFGPPQDPENFRSTLKEERMKLLTKAKHIFEEAIRIAIQRTLEGPSPRDISKELGLRTTEIRKRLTRSVERAQESWKLTDAAFRRVDARLRDEKKLDDQRYDEMLQAARALHREGTEWATTIATVMSSQEGEDRHVHASLNRTLYATIFDPIVAARQEMERLLKTTEALGKTALPAHRFSLCLDAMAPLSDQQEEGPRPVPETHRVFAAQVHTIQTAVERMIIGAENRPLKEHSAQYQLRLTDALNAYTRSVRQWQTLEDLIDLNGKTAQLFRHYRGGPRPSDGVGRAVVHVTQQVASLPLPLREQIDRALRQAIGEESDKDPKNSRREWETFNRQVKGKQQALTAEIDRLQEDVRESTAALAREIAEARSRIAVEPLLETARNEINLLARQLHVVADQVAEVEPPPIRAVGPIEKAVVGVAATMGLAAVAGPPAGLAAGLAALALPHAGKQGALLSLAGGAVAGTLAPAPLSTILTALSGGIAAYSSDQSALRLGLDATFPTVWSGFNQILALVSDPHVLRCFIHYGLEHSTETS